ncbi:hypothetical protein BSKO_09008 [Bryopsis sp. KO-2023]|nr:hypothetical protein BSKO_09008 [Bryopsis sp. KO-2023]
MHRCSAGRVQQPGVGLQNRVLNLHRKPTSPLHNHGPLLPSINSRSRQTPLTVQAGLWDRFIGLFRGGNSDTDEYSEDSSEMAIARKNATLVFGASGRVGRLVVKELVDSEGVVVAAARSAEKTLAALAEVGVSDGVQGKSKGALIVQEGVDLVDENALTEDLFAGVERVIVCVGRGPQDSAAEQVDFLGVQNIAAAVKKFLPEADTSPKQIVNMVSAKDLSKWERLDDVIMGGQSESKMALSEDGSGIVFTGQVVVEGGGFCGHRTVSLDVEDLSDYDGIAMRVKGDGQIFKINVKSKPQEDIPESTYQATFETTSGQWCDVRIPWHEFVPVKRARYDPSEGPMDLANVKRFALVSSRFDFNGMANPKFSPEPFSLEVQGGIGVYKAARPRVVLLSAAGVERNAIIGDDKEKRKDQIPIIKLNPGGVLNYKYDGEIALRNSGVPYAIVRSTGFQDSTEDCLLEASQGDTMIGVITRGEVASTLVHASRSPGAAYKTFEVRRGYGREAKGKTMSDGDFRALFLQQVHDWRRVRVGLPPFPAACPPPSPVTEDEKKEILEDVVKTRQEMAEVKA